MQEIKRLVRTIFAFLMRPIKRLFRAIPFFERIVRTLFRNIPTLKVIYLRLMPHPSHQGRFDPATASHVQAVPVKQPLAPRKWALTPRAELIFSDLKAVIPQNDIHKDRGTVKLDSASPPKGLL